MSSNNLVIQEESKTDERLAVDIQVHDEGEIKIVFNDDTYKVFKCTDDLREIIFWIQNNSKSWKEDNPFGKVIRAFLYYKEAIG